MAATPAPAPVSSAATLVPVAPPSADESTHHDADPEARQRRRVVGLFAGPPLFTALALAPFPLTHSQHMLTAVLALAMTFWVTEALPPPVTGLLALAFCALLGVPPGPGRPADAIFAQFASPVLFLLIGSFVLAQAMIKYGLSRRIALRVLLLPGVARSTYLVLIAMGLLAMALAATMEAGAVVAMLLPIALGVDRTLSAQIRLHAGIPEDVPLRFSAGLMLMTAYAATIGALLTPIGHPANLIGQRFIESELGHRVRLGEWVVLAAPIVVAGFVVLSLILLLVNKPEVGRIRGARRLIEEERRTLGPVSKGEINTLLVFVLAISLWLLPSVVGIVAGDASPLHLFLRARLSSSVVAIVAASLLFVLPVSWRERRFTLRWRDAVKIDWGTVLLMGSGLTLGKLMVDTGLAKVVGHRLGSLGGGTVLVYVLAAATAILLSETTSNTASVGIIVPIIPSLAVVGGADPLTAALVATFAASYGFMLPISSSANAIAFGSGAVPLGKMIRSGFIVDLSGIPLIVAVVYVMRHVVGVG